MLFRFRRPESRLPSAAAYGKAASSTAFALARRAKLTIKLEILSSVALHDIPWGYHAQYISVSAAVGGDEDRRDTALCGTALAKRTSYLVKPRVGVYKAELLCHMPLRKMCIRDRAWSSHFVFQLTGTIGVVR